MGRNTATTSDPRLKGLCDGTLSGHLAYVHVHEPASQVEDGVPFLSLYVVSKCRLRVQAPGRGSFSPVATFKLCS